MGDPAGSGHTVRAIGRYLRVSPRKARAVIQTVRGQEPRRALTVLAQMAKAAAVPVRKVLASALANAEQVPELRQQRLMFVTFKADDGPKLKRFRAGAMGRAMRIQHRTSHVTVELRGQGPARRARGRPRPAGA